MALKEWTGKRTTKYNSEYTNIKTNEKLAIVAGFGNSFIVYNGKYPFITPTIDEVFDNRSQALKFAKEYMRKN